MNTQTSPAPFRLGFIGAGKLAGSVIRGPLPRLLRATARSTSNQTQQARPGFGVSERENANGHQPEGTQR